VKKLLRIFMASLLLVGCSAPNQTASYRQITMDEAVKIMEEKTGYIRYNSNNGIHT